MFLVTPEGAGLKLALIGIHVVPGQDLSRIAQGLLKPLGADLAGMELLGGFEKEVRSTASQGLAVRDIERIGSEAVRRQAALEVTLKGGRLRTICSPCCRHRGLVPMPMDSLPSRRRSPTGSWPAGAAARMGPARRLCG